MNQAGASATKTSRPVGAGESQTMDKSESEASWDPATFENQKEGSPWKESKQQSKNVTRLQDLSLGLSSSNHNTEKNAKKEESWPYESSPCRMYGGKNTRPGGEAINKELFKTEFDKEKKDPDFDFADTDDADEFGEEAIHDTALAVVEETEDEAEAEPTPSRSRSTHKPRKDKSEPKALVRTAGKGESSSSSTKLDRSSGQDSEETKSDRQPTRPLRRSNSVKNLKKSSARNSELGVSCHGNIETAGKSKEPRKTRRKDDTTEESVADPNGPVSHSRSGAVARAPLRRTRTGDGLEDLSRHRANTRDEMVGEARKSSRRKPKSDSKDGRRSLTRAMSTANVKKPEDYGPRASAAAAAAADSAAADSADAGSSHTRGGSARGGDELRLSDHSSKSRQKSSGRRSAGGGDELGSHSAHTRTSRRGGGGGDDELGAQSAHTSISRQKSSGRRKVESERSLSKDRKSRSRRAVESESEEEFGGEKKESTPDRKPTLTRRRGTSTRNLEPRRDLLILLREQKTVTQKDLADKENRRLLHFLIYEHKMGVSLTELEKSVREEKEAGIAPDRTQRLYIET
jgi:hypothetical protein